MTKSKQSKKRQIDWPAIEAAYLEGQVFRAIAERHGIHSSTIYRRALRDKWASGRPAHRPTLRITATPVGSSGGELAQLKTLAAKLRERFENLIDGHRTYGGKILGARESPAALLLKLCQISEKIITIERRLAGTDDPTSTQLSEQDRDILDRFKRRYGVH